MSTLSPEAVSSIRKRSAARTRALLAERIEAGQVREDQLPIVLALLYVGDRVGDEVDDLRRQVRGGIV